MQLLEILCFVLVFDIVKLKQVRIEDVTAKQLEAAVELEENLAVIWYGKNCKTCDRVLSLLEDKIGQHTEKAGITLLSINDKKLAKNYNIRNFPTITIIRSGDQMVYDGDMMDSGSILDFILSVHESENNEIPHVTVDKLDETVATNKYVAVFFYSAEKGKPEFEKIANLKQITNELDIRLASTSDLALVSEYNLNSLPSLVFYRNTVPLLYEGIVSEEENILEWLVQNRHSGDSSTNQIENISAKSLQTMISNLKMVLVFNYLSISSENQLTLKILEKLDDRCSFRAIHFVKKGSETESSIILYKNHVPTEYKGNLLEEAEIAKWIEQQLETSSEMAPLNDLTSLINEMKNVLIVLCKYIAYGIIALTHTCFLLKNFTSHDYKNVLPKEKLKGLASEL